MLNRRVLSMLIFGGACLLTALLAIPRQVAAVPKGDPKAGLAIHKDNCMRCHGEQGRGDGAAGKFLRTKPADWTDKTRMSKATDADLFKLISKGGESLGLSKLMPSFGDKLSAKEINDAISFIRTLAK